MKRYLVVFVIGMLVSCDNSKSVVNDSPITYSFFVAGHTYGKPGVNEVGLYPSFRNKFERIQNHPEMAFGILTGDIVINGTEQNWDEVDNDLELLNIDTYFAAGNHDMTNRDLYESRYGDSYFKFEHQGDLFIILDPNIDSWNISQEQLAFFESALDQSETVDNIFIFTHQLLWWEEDNIYQNVRPNSLEGRDETTNFWTELEPMIHSLSNSVVWFAGDLGAHQNGCNYMYHQYDNIAFIASGMGIGVNDNFIIVNIHQDKSISYELIALSGNEDKLGELTDFILK